MAGRAYCQIGRRLQASGDVRGTRDPDGRRVVLTDDRWAHIKQRHPDVVPHLGEVMRAIREPDRRAEGRKHSEEWYFEWSGPARWLRVVVHYEHGEGTVMTAFPESSS
jgi:hypothetical protein